MRIVVVSKMTFNVVTTIILISSLFQTTTEELQCDGGCPIDGSSYNITCQGASVGGCVWYQDSSLVMSCNESGQCDADQPGYTGFRISDGHYVLQIHNLTTSSFQCQIGREASKSCSITTVEAMPTGEVSATCSANVLTCSGLNDHGTPPVLLQLLHGDTELSSVPDGGIAAHKPLKSAGETYTCAVKGPGSKCLSRDSVKVTCSPILQVIILAISLTTFTVTVTVTLVVYLAKRSVHQRVSIACGTVLLCVGTGCSIVILFLSTLDSPLNRAAASFSIMDFVVGIIFMLVGLFLVKRK